VTTVLSFLDASSFGIGLSWIRECGVCFLNATIVPDDWTAKTNGIGRFEGVRKEKRNCGCVEGNRSCQARAEQNDLHVPLFSAFGI
jgi:hypothetical protein